MKKYTDGNREIMATERAFEVIYKSQGFKEATSRSTKPKNNDNQVSEETEAGKEQEVTKEQKVN